MLPIGEPYCNKVGRESKQGCADRPRCALVSICVLTNTRQFRLAFDTYDRFSQVQAQPADSDPQSSHGSGYLRLLLKWGARKADRHRRGKQTGDTLIEVDHVV